MSSTIDLHPFGYQIERVIGQGRFGSVVQIREKASIERMLVCKVIILDSLSESDRRLAEQEVTLLRSLNHPSIVKFENIVRVQSGSSVGLIMEYCDGGDLRHAIKQQSMHCTYFSERQILIWFVQLLDGLRFIHANRIIHRDMKTSNIFLKGPPPFRCLIGDFGISRVLEETLSPAHTVIGTPYYLSPEVVKREPYTIKSDMWSLGACLYEMTMLKMAFRSNNLLSLVSRIINDSFEPVDRTRYSDDLIKIIHRLLSKDPGERPSADELLSEPFLSDYMDETVTSTPIEIRAADVKRRSTLRSRLASRRPPVLVPAEAPDASEGTSPEDFHDCAPVNPAYTQAMIVQESPPLPLLPVSDRMVEIPSALCPMPRPPPSHF